MATMTYKEQLLHPNWQRKRLEILERDGFKCLLCGETERTLHVHHKRYVKGRAVWEYEGDELQSLCDVCHADQHETHALLEEVLAKANIMEPYTLALAVAAGYLEGSYALDAELATRVRAKVGALFDLGIAASILALAPRPLAAAALRSSMQGRESDPAAELLLRRWEALGSDEQGDQGG